MLCDIDLVGVGRWCIECLCVCPNSYTYNPCVRLNSDTHDKPCISRTMDHENVMVRPTFIALGYMRLYTELKRLLCTLLRFTPSVGKLAKAFSMRSSFSRMVS